VVLPCRYSKFGFKFCTRHKPREVLAGARGRGVGPVGDEGSSSQLGSESTDDDMENLVTFEYFEGSV